ncbi:hypothetical protein [Acinetobacter pittii]|uniref:hypothetical protein n=1 Tax=Acinetobacter pittii TaxID=48296 RepID=UPI000D39DCAF|nr:hypothetical protein [Acinetobacter pittii]PTV48797.1 hypothetical protein DBL01_08260 [Acinetobacter pittii]
MQTSHSFKILIVLLILLFSAGFHIENEKIELAAIFNFLQPFFAIIMISNLRTSLICFYKTQNTPLNFLHPNNVNQNDLNNLSKLSKVMLFFYSNTPFVEEKYLNYCATKNDVVRYLANLNLINENLDNIRKPYFLLTKYSITSCLEAATWSLICLIMSMFLTYFIPLIF